MDDELEKTLKRMRKKEERLNRVRKQYGVMTGRELDILMSGWAACETEIGLESLAEYDEEDDPTPCCYQHGCGAISTTEPCPKIADND